MTDNERAACMAALTALEHIQRVNSNPAPTKFTFDGALIDNLRAVLAQPAANDAQRCIDARNRLNAALHGDGAVIDDLESAVAEACSRLEQPTQPQGGPVATWGPCCNIIREGVCDPGTVHSGACRERHGGELGPTHYLYTAPQRVAQPLTDAACLALAAKHGAGWPDVAECELTREALFALIREAAHGIKGE
jgi:hypothetical protein